MPFLGDVSHPETAVKGGPSRVQVAEVVAVNADDGTIDASPLNGRATKVHITYPSWWLPQVGERCLVVDRDGDPRQPICLGYLGPADGSLSAPQTRIGGASSKATDTVFGITRLSVAAVASATPIAVGDNDPRVPTQSENDALVGTSGAPSSSNKYVTNSDTRMTNSRTPTGAAGGELAGTYPNPTLQRATASVFGAVELSVAPAVAGTPIAVGDNDTRMTNSRTPTGAAGGELAGTYPNPTLQRATASVFGAVELSVAPAVAGTPIAVGDNDTRMTNSRTPTGAAGGELAGTYPNPTLQRATASVFGAVELSVAPAVAGTPIAVGDNDTRMTNARTPTAHASSHASGGSDPITIAESQVTNLTTDLATAKKRAEFDVGSAFDGTNATTNDAKRVVWNRTSDGSYVASIESYETGSGATQKDIVQDRVEVPGATSTTGALARRTIEARVRQTPSGTVQTDWARLIVEAIAGGGGAARLEVTPQGQTDPYYTLKLLDDAGKSDLWPPVVTSLPTTGPGGVGTPVDGQECHLLADTGSGNNNGVTWHLKYRAAEAGSYKWYFVGGQPLRYQKLQSAGAETITSTTGYANLPTTGAAAKVTLPTGVGGDFLVGIQGLGDAVSDGQQTYLSFTVGATGANDDWAIRWRSNNFQSNASQFRINSAAAAAVFTLQGKVTTTGGRVFEVGLYVLPIRVG